MTTVAALFVEYGGVYYGSDDIEPWGWPNRDAREYGGPHPVIAHPPCSRWCRLAGLVEARWGHKKGDDGGTFLAALNAVRAYGGVLEHPAYSDAWEAFGLPIPDRNGGWTERDQHGGASAYVEQSRYGHVAKKATWLYAVAPELPELRWGFKHDHKAGALVSWCGNHVKSGESRPRVGKHIAARTPPEFRQALLAIARSASRAQLAGTQVTRREK